MDVDGVKSEPFEKVIVNCPSDFASTISDLLTISEKETYKDIVTTLETIKGNEDDHVYAGRYALQHLYVQLVAPVFKGCSG